MRPRVGRRGSDWTSSPAGRRKLAPTTMHGHDAGRKSFRPNGLTHLWRRASLPGMESSPGRTSLAGPDDAPLVVASQKGDQAAFGEIVRRYQRAVHRLAWSL